MTEFFKYPEEVKAVAIEVVLERTLREAARSSWESFTQQEYRRFWACDDGIVAGRGEEAPA
jgi:uncharacterized protein YndB with AHSA1/START domain